MGKSSDPFENDTLNRLQMFTCLIPVFGMFPAAWVMSRRKSDRQLRHLSRLSLSLGVLWGLGFLLMNTGVGVSDSGGSSAAGLGILVTNTVWSSGYFVTLLWLMFRLWKGRSLSVPGVSQVAKYLP